MDVVVGDEEVGVGGGNDYDFWRAAAVAAVEVGGEGGDVGAHVGGELVVPEVDGGVVDA